MTGLDTKKSEYHHPTPAQKVPRPEGLEPSTYGLEIRCSILLSYGRPTS
jgi:hypothetical protein